MKALVVGLCAVLMALMLSSLGLAAEAPILKELKGPEKARVERLIREAKREGKLGWSTNFVRVNSAKKFAKAFKELYGLNELDVDFYYRTTGTTVKRVEEEVRAGKLTVDVIMQGTAVWLHSMRRRGELLRYESPEDKHYGPAARAGMNAPGYWVADAQINAVSWNPKFTGGDVKIKSWHDLLEPRFKGKVMIGDASRSESYTLWYMGLRTRLPKSFFEKLAANGVGILYRGDAQRRALIAGEFWIGGNVMPRHNLVAILQGAKLIPAYPKEGVVTVPIASPILAKADHPNVAKLFVDFWRSARGKCLLLEETAINVGYGNLPPCPSERVNNFILKEIAPPIDKINVIPMKWDKLTAADIKKARAEWVSIFGRLKR